MSGNDRIEAAVRASLQDDARLKHPELIAVSADEIGTVVLRGAVVSLRQRNAAVQDARDVEGVFGVVADDLRLHPPLAEIRADDEIRAAALQSLISDERIRSKHVHVKVSHGHVTLSGYVREELERDAAIEDVTAMTGVLDVTDKIELR
ncbi:MAG TPA: BON domain-containing protein [Solirubrobacteraceae bacterium]|nr:BON domain-containing protein [Solirubrobacteraceae bacterium]